MNYNYSALDEAGRRIRGNMKAVNEYDLEERLKAINLDLVDFSVKKDSQFALLGSVSSKDLIILCIHLEQLDRAGVPILEAIEDLRDTSDAIPFKNLMAEIYESVKGGKVLSEAFAEHPKVFNEVFVGLIAAGEKTGNLHDIFHHLAMHLKWVHSIQAKVKKATYYPLFLLLLMGGITSLMMLFVIPKLSTFLTAQNFELPFYTQSLIDTSDFFKSYWYTLFLVPLFLYISIKVLKKSSEGFAYYLDYFKLSVPWIGPTIRKIELARFCHFFSITFKSGIGILECLDVANNVVQNKVVKQSVFFARKNVSEGMALTQALTLSSQFPNLVIRMFKVGEDSGNLDSTLENINFFYDQEVENSVNNMIGLIQPALTIVMGGLMLWISMAIFGPLYGSFSKMSF